MNLFERIFTISDSANSLDTFLLENMRSVNDFYNSDYTYVETCKDSIDSFILLKTNVIDQLDYKKSYNRAFISILLDFCERFNFIASTPRIHSILKKNDINIGHRLQAALLFLYPRPRSNSELVERFEIICEHIQIALDTEEDNDKNALATFLNYYAIIINDTRLQFAEEFRLKIIRTLENENYPFLKSEYISEALKIDLQNSVTAFNEIQQLIDRILRKKPRIKEFASIDFDGFLIEQDTDYSLELESVPRSFDSIRAISVSHSDGRSISNRGVKIPVSEEELYSYMRRMGNMHDAKLRCALESLPKRFPTKVNIIDWGCGQGIASMVFLEKIGDKNVNNIFLIEPSEIAIKRAALHIRKFTSSIPINTICKKLDEISEDDMINNKTEVTIHLFSNILDIDDYSQNKLIDLIRFTQSDENFFVCVSPNINEIKTERLNSFKRYFEIYHTDSYNLLLEETTTKSVNDEYWLCNNNRYKKEIRHGIYMNCEDYTVKGGCGNKWTRVIRVFKVNL